MTDITPRPNWKRRKTKGLYKRGSDWSIEYYVDGRRKRETIGPSLKQAQDVLRKRKVEMAENRFLDVKKNEKIKFVDFTHTYMELHARPNKRSWKTDRGIIKRMIPFFGHRYLYEITPMMVEQYKAQRKERKSYRGVSLKPAAVNRELAVLKVMFTKAIDWGKARENPVMKVKYFKEDNQRIRYLEKEEIKKLLDASSPRLRAVLIVALNTGMRKGELQNLKWRDVDFKNNVITLLETKSGYKRDIPLNTGARKALMTFRKHPESAYIFCERHGNPYNFRQSFETALKKSGILSFRFHDLRHTFASHLAMGGVDLNTIRELLGHKSLDMTLRYSHLSKDHKSRAVAILDNQIDASWTSSDKSTNRRLSGKSVSDLASLN